MSYQADGEFVLTLDHVTSRVKCLTKQMVSLLTLDHVKLVVTLSINISCKVSYQADGEFVLTLDHVNF